MAQNFFQATAEIVNEIVTKPAKKFLPRAHSAEKNVPRLSFPPPSASGRRCRRHPKMNQAAVKAAAQFRKMEGKLLNTVVPYLAASASLASSSASMVAMWSSIRTT